MYRNDQCIHTLLDLIEMCCFICQPLTELYQLFVFQNNVIII